VDTNASEVEGQKRFRSGDEYAVTGRSFLLLVLEPEAERSIGLRRALAAFRQMAEQPIPVANSEPETAAALETEQAPG
jgi:hypothetical protein